MNNEETTIYWKGYVDSCIDYLRSAGDLANRFDEANFRLVDATHDCDKVHLSFKWEKGYRKIRSATRSDTADYAVLRDFETLILNTSEGDAHSLICTIIETVDYVNLDE